MRNQYHLEKQRILHGKCYRGINWVDSKKGRAPTAKVTIVAAVHLPTSSTHHQPTFGSLPIIGAHNLNTSGNQSSSSSSTMVNPHAVLNHYVTNLELRVHAMQFLYND
jgi:hypothetical protein